MDIINKCLTLNEFRHYIKDYNFGFKPANKLVVHHTYKPNKETWAGSRSILGLKGYYERKGWNAGPHLFIAEDGIWLFSPMRKDGIHAGSLNHCSIGIEVVGDYSYEKWSGKTKFNTFGAIKSLLRRLDIGEEDIYFHRDASPKSCPGYAITKEWLLYELVEFKLTPMIPKSDDLSDVVRNTTAPAPVDYYSSDSMVLIQVPDWAEEAVDFISRKHKLFKIRNAEDVRHAVRFYRFYKLINN